MGEPVELIYRGMRFTRQDHRWVDAENDPAPSFVQSALDKLYAEKLPLENAPLEELVALAENFRNRKTYTQAVRFYRAALERAERAESPEAVMDTVLAVYPALCDCYRNLGQSREAVQLYADLDAQYGEAVHTHILLTAAANACCDLHDYGAGKHYADWAYGLLDGRETPELANVYQRLRRENSTK